MIHGLDSTLKQEEFATLVGVTQPRVAQLLGEGVLPRDGTARQWLLAYCERLREQAGSRSQELTVERAGLAREQRIAQALKNAVLQREYAPVGLLTDVLAAASAAVSTRLEALPADLRKVCPELPDAARTAIASTVASARNEWVRATASIANAALDDLTEAEAIASEPDAAAPLPGEDEGGAA